MGGEFNKKKYIPIRIREKRKQKPLVLDNVHECYEDYFSEINVDKYFNEYIVKRDEIEREFERKTKLTKIDTAFLVYAAAIQSLRWSVLSNDKFRFDKAADSDKAFSRLGRASHCKTIEQILSDHTVPYDVLKYSSKMHNFPGLSGNNHRYMTLGHDPILGLLVGTANIATGTVTINKFDFINPYPTYAVKNNMMVAEIGFFSMLYDTIECALNDPKIIAVSLCKQILHMSTDIFTRQGLPIPGINLVSSELPKFLCSNVARIDTYSTVRSVLLAMYVNRIVEMLHRLFYNPCTDGGIELYNIRTRKVLT